jgi:hypothetical protein
MAQPSLGVDAVARLLTRATMQHSRDGAAARHGSSADDDRSPFVIIMFAGNGGEC